MTTSPAPGQPLSAEEAKSTSILEPQGVHGWLLFFCVCLIILQPLFWTGSVVLDLKNNAELYALIPFYRNAVYFGYLAKSLLLLYGFIVGCQIWKGDPRGWGLAQRYLILRIISLIAINMILARITKEFLPQLTIAALILCLEVVGEYVYFHIWWLYFKKSERVRNTYGTQP